MKNPYLLNTHLKTEPLIELVRCFANEDTAIEAAMKINVHRNTVQRIYELLRKRVLKWSVIDSNKYLEEKLKHHDFTEVEEDESSEPITHLIIQINQRKIGITASRYAHSKRHINRSVLSNANELCMTIMDAKKLLSNSSTTTSIQLFGSKLKTLHNLILDEQNRHNEMRLKVESRRLWLQKINPSLIAPDSVYSKQLAINSQLFPSNSSKGKTILDFFCFAKRQFIATNGVIKNLKKTSPMDTKCLSQKDLRFLEFLKESEWRFNNRSKDLSQIILKKLLRKPLGTPEI